MAQQMGMPPGPQPKKSGGMGSLFASKPPPMPDVSGIQEDVGNVSRRLRVLEESFTNMRRAIQVTEQNMLQKHKHFATEIRTITSDISDIKKEMHEVKERMIDLVKELEDSAKREQVKVLEKYINMWNPVKFVSQKEVIQIVKEMLEKEKNKQKTSNSN